MGFLYNQYCYSTNEEASAAVYAIPQVVVVGTEVYFPSFVNGAWIMQGPGIKTKELGSLSFQTCSDVGPIYPAGEMVFQSDFYSVIFWAVGISAAFLLFKRAVV
jgi:hypothetical protein